MRQSVYRGSRNCPVCGCNIKQKVFSVKMVMDANIELPDVYNVAECDYCGCCYADTSATAEDYDQYYETNNFYGEMDIEISSYKNLFSITINQLRKLNISEEKMLDIGFGKGELDIELKQNGFPNISGIDPSQSSVNRLKQYGIEAHVGSIYDKVPEALQKQYKVIFMYGMIEHLYDPFLAIKRAKEYLEVGGYMFWEVPVFDDMREDLTPIVNNFNQEHINYFSAISLDNLAKMNGLKKIVSYREVVAEKGDSKAYGLINVYQVGEEENYDITRDCVTAKSIEEYYLRIGQNFDTTKDTIDKLYRSCEKIAIWGTGAYVMNLWATTDLDRCNISFFIDNNTAKIGKKILGRDVVAPQQLAEFKGTIVICSMMYAEDIKEQIQKMELDNRVIIL